MSHILIIANCISSRTKANRRIKVKFPSASLLCWGLQQPSRSPLVAFLAVFYENKSRFSSAIGVGLSAVQWKVIIRKDDPDSKLINDSINNRCHWFSITCPFGLLLASRWIAAEKGRTSTEGHKSIHALTIWPFPRSRLERVRIQWVTIKWCNTARDKLWDRRKRQLVPFPFVPELRCITTQSFISI